MRWLAVLIVTVFMSVALPAAGAELDGFRGLKWGTQLVSLNKEEFTLVPPFRGIAPDTESYRRKDDELKVAGMPVDNINYNFRKGRLASVNIDFKGYPVYEKLMAYCREQFGPPTGSMVRNMEVVSTFEANGTGVLFFYQLSTPQYSDGRLFLYSRDFFE